MSAAALSELDLQSPGDAVLITIAASDPGQLFGPDPEAARRRFRRLNHELELIAHPLGSQYLLNAPEAARAQARLEEFWTRYQRASNRFGYPSPRWLQP